MRGPISRTAAFAIATALVLIALTRLSSPPSRPRLNDVIVACNGAATGADGSQRCLAVRAFQRGLRALDPLTLYVGEVWFLQQLLRIYPNAELQRRVERAVTQLVADPSVRLLNPAARSAPLPEDPGRGIKRLSHYVLAPVGTPAARAAQFVADFVARDERGYALTHQLLVLEWAEQAGLHLPAATRDRRNFLLQRIAAEQSQEAGFNDLFVERAAILLMLGAPPRAAAAGWVATIMAAQLADGGWVDRQRSPLVFDGQESVAMHPPGHTTALAVTALGFFLTRY